MRSAAWRLKMSRVFVLEPPRPDIDISLSNEYGDLVILFDNETRRSSVFRTAAFGHEILEKLREYDFDPENDLICIVGSLIGVTVLISAAMAAYETFSVLFYSASDTKYVERRVGLEVWE